MAHWRAYYALFPFDDLHRYHRPAALIATPPMEKGRHEEFIANLELLAPSPKIDPAPSATTAADKTSSRPRYSQADLNTLNALLGGAKKQPKKD